MADFKLATTTPSDIMLGSSSVSKVYMGPTLVWPLSSNPIRVGTSGGSSVGSGTSLTSTYPTVNNNDILILHLRFFGTAIPTVPSGWILIQSISLGGAHKQYAYYRRSDGTESGTFTTTLSVSSTNIIGIISRYSGVKTSGIPYENPSNNFGFNTQIYQFNPSTGSLGNNRLAVMSYAYSKASGFTTLNAANSWVDDFGLDVGSSPTGSLLVKDRALATITTPVGYSINHLSDPNADNSGICFYLIPE